jgi:hypothetical protein
VSKFFAGISSILKSSVFWGGLASLGFFTLIHNHSLPNEKFFVRYFAGHWVEYVETIFFFIGVAELLLKAFELADQRAKMRKPLLVDAPTGPLPASDARLVLDHLLAMPRRDQQGYFPRRLREALETVLRKGSANTLEDDLKYLSEVDAARAHGGYALMRIVIWAIPILGFLGTVIGITDAISSLNPKDLESSLDQVTAGLGVAFDTTAIALGLSMALMFGQFVVDKVEGRLLGDVDAKAADELTGRFEMTGTDRDPQVAIVERLADAVIKNVERLVERQSAVWQNTIDSAHHRWSELTTSGQQHIEAALNKSLVRGVQAHAEHLAAAEVQSAKQNRKHWRRIHKGLVESTQAAQSQQVELVKQSQVLLQVVEATGQVTKLEDTLNNNLAALAGAQHFQETLLNLTAAVHLLNARLGQVAPMGPHVALKDHPVGKAA